MFQLSIILVGITIYTVTATKNIKCGRPELAFYEDNGCTPEYEGKDCPSYFICPEIQEKTEKCFYSGKYFDIGESIKPSKPCNFCRCFKSNGGKPKIMCAQPKCFQPKGNETCYYKDALDKCCRGSSELVCGRKGSCKINGLEYAEGDTFTPKNECLKCVCSKADNYEFNEASCRREVCDIALKNYDGFKNYCALMFYESGACCPIKFICPNEIKRKFYMSNGIKEGVPCNFGNVMYYKGDRIYVKTAAHSVTCECLLPPYLTCIRNN